MKPYGVVCTNVSFLDQIYKWVCPMDPQIKKSFHFVASKNGKRNKGKKKKSNGRNKGKKLKMF